jgi:hypothetical protein
MRVGQVPWNLVGISGISSCPPKEYASFSDAATTFTVTHAALTTDDRRIPAESRDSHGR